MDQSLKINSLDELGLIMARLFWIESKMEMMVQWEAFMKLDQKFHDLIFELSHESMGHKNALVRLGANLKGYHIESAASDMRDMKLDLDGKLEGEIMGEIKKADLLALNLYQRLLEHTDRDFLRSVWTGDDPEDFFREIQKIIQQEKEHVDQLAPHTWSYERIR